MRLSRNAFSPESAGHPPSGCCSRTIVPRWRNPSAPAALPPERHGSADFLRVRYSFIPLTQGSVCVRSALTFAKDLNLGLRANYEFAEFHWQQGIRATSPVVAVSRKENWLHNSTSTELRSAMRSSNSTMKTSSQEGRKLPRRSRPRKAGKHQWAEPEEDHQRGALGVSRLLPATRDPDRPKRIT